MSYVETINNTPVTFNDLWEVQEELGEFIEFGEGDSEAIMYITSELFKDDPNKAAAVMFRMLALARIVITENVPGWTLPKLPNGKILTHECMFSAAAVQPLVESGKDLIFEKEAFLLKALEFSDAQGNA